ncbi:BZ3500_MvSof-1268-A1-R1_Chr4-1g06769 [Microbotryum saponariae]|uniref:BZ3500_MvSof-1268-A1-R1_Chr4-1g06754 protein n=1 Tax=Microbotryum saponariae TaxID=289078 RepID=A0A2X0KY25_9BASI|nr:BZ3500_MvSof-1268-A1-R1_Chr4-1g06754 [Microbotryum saponariae]SCZ96828.1 BZ3500_MvSof-1268-A1-R1_Chr4-1g06761 [Microbotryum saponariae]SCZ96836.1 BZ3500_MvSof-1268-A1-R1_Chr4-1g06769 [Microbotryum saponariae]SDA06419.1 BZ3501_MvSof-1269-A2-R1_Chr4-1g06464 [Microbotryum saponariae]SDA06426.1 BZ3501_MvSof-1269-A2-R1_Chr4-1g06471 [Microbotryum saponariae]
MSRPKGRPEGGLLHRNIANLSWAEGPSSPQEETDGFHRASIPLCGLNHAGPPIARNREH